MNFGEREREKNTRVDDDSNLLFCYQLSTGVAAATARKETVEENPFPPSTHTNAH